MDELPAPVWDQRTVDKRHLGTLSILHFVGAGLAVLGLAFVALHFTFMSAVFNNPEVWKGTPNPPPAGVFDVFRWLYVVLAGWYGTSLMLNLLAGFYLRSRKHRTFCIVVAAFDCLHIPLGTVLGIFTIIVLARDSVRRAFEADAGGLDPLP
jgi:hypothetical protein